MPVMLRLASGGRGCQFPMWRDAERPGPNPLFCGNPRRDEECSYCPQHARIAYVAAPRFAAA